MIGVVIFCGVKPCIEFWKTGLIEQRDYLGWDDRVSVCLDNLAWLRERLGRKSEAEHEQDGSKTVRGEPPKNGFDGSLTLPGKRRSCLNRHFHPKLSLRWDGGFIGISGVKAAYNDFQEFPGAAGESVDLGGVRGPLDQRRKDVFATKRHGQTGERDGLKELVVIDFTEPGPAILILWEIPMIFDAETPDFFGARLNVRDWIQVQVVHDVSGVIVDFHAFIRNFTDNISARSAGSGIAAMLFDDQQNTVITGDRSQFPKSFDPYRTTAAFRMAEGENLGNPRCGGLANPVRQDFKGIFGFRIDSRKHHQRSQSSIPASHTEFFRRARRSFRLKNRK